MTLESLARTETVADQMAIKIRQRLVAMGQSQAALAKALGVPAMWLSDRLRGTVQLTVNDAARIADTLGVALVDLLPESARRAPELNGHYVGTVTAAYTPQTGLLAGLHAVTLRDEDVAKIRHGDGRRRPDGRSGMARASPQSI